MKVAEWIKLKEELVKLDVVSRVDLHFLNNCFYDEYKDDVRNWVESVWISCPMGCLLNRERINKLLDFRDKHNLEMEISNGDDIRFTEKIIGGKKI